MKQRILITGATGFVGKQLVVQLMKPNCELFLLVRSGCASAFADLDVNVIEHASIEQYRGQELPEKLDCIIHLVAKAHVTEKEQNRAEYERVNVAGTQALCDVARRLQVSHFIYLSSIKVNADATSAGPISEHSQPEPTGVYAETKFAAEQLAQGLVEDGIRVSVVRPPLVYGGGVKANMAALVKLVKWLPILPFGRIANKRSFLSVRNLCDFIMTLAFKEPQQHYNSEVFIVSDGEAFSTAQLCQTIAKGMNKQPIMLNISVAFLSTITRLLGLQAMWSKLTSSLHVSGVNPQQYYQWTPPFAASEEIAALTKEAN